MNNEPDRANEQGEINRMKRFAQSILALAAFSAVLAVPAAALAQAQSKEQQACINSLNKGMYKVSGTQGKITVGCITAFAKGSNSDAFACYDFSSKVETARLANCTAQSTKCPSPPGFGPTDCLAGNNISEAEGKNLAEEIFGAVTSPSVASCETDLAKCKCQARALKASYRLLSARLKTFNACKKNGLKHPEAPYVSSTDLETCLNVDPNQVIDSAIVKLQVAVAVGCTGVASPFDAGACAGLTGVSLIDCLEDRTRCRACNTIAYSDNLGTACDGYDDGILNSSCPVD
jgi:hypothetical protein